MFPLLLLSSYASVLWTLPEINCIGCEEKIEEVMSEIEGATVASFSLDDKTVCIDGLFDEAEARSKLKSAGFTVTSPKSDVMCVKPSNGSLWANIDGDVRIISTGARVSFRKEKVKGKYTLFDFGASWCPPCLVSTRLLTPILEKEDFLALRAIEFEGDIQQSFESPVAFQHLSDASGLPWFVLFNPDGEEIYSGNDIQQVLALLDN